MSEEKRYKKIEDWLAGELSKKDQQEFEAQLKKDEALALEAEVVRDLKRYSRNQDRNRLRETITDIRSKEHSTKVVNFNWRPVLGLAASLLLLVGAFFFFTARPPLPNTYVNIPPDQIQFFEPDHEATFAEIALRRFNDSIDAISDNDAAIMVMNLEIVDGDTIVAADKDWEFLKNLIWEQQNNPIIEHEMQQFEKPATPHFELPFYRKADNGRLYFKGDVTVSETEKKAYQFKVFSIASADYLNNQPIAVQPLVLKEAGENSYTFSIKRLQLEGVNLSLPIYVIIEEVDSNRIVFMQRFD